MKFNECIYSCDVVCIQSFTLSSSPVCLFTYLFICFDLWEVVTFLLNTKTDFVTPVIAIYVIFKPEFGNFKRFIAAVPVSFNTTMVIWVNLKTRMVIWVTKTCKTGMFSLNQSQLIIYMYKYHSNIKCYDKVSKFQRSRTNYVTKVMVILSHILDNIR